MMKGEKCTGGKLSWILVVIGAINWGLIGLGGFFGGNWNVVNLIFGSLPWLEWIIYILVGIAGVGMLFGCRCKTCKPKGGDMKMGGGDMGGHGGGGGNM